MNWHSRLLKMVWNWRGSFSFPVIIGKRVASYDAAIMAVPMLSLQLGRAVRCCTNSITVLMSLPGSKRDRHQRLGVG